MSHGRFESMTELQSFEASSLQVTDSEGLRFITFNAPRTRNALTLADLRAVTHAVETPPEGIRALVFKGAGELAFSSGLHLTTFRNLDPEQALDVITHVRDVLAAVRTSPLPTAAIIQGPCLGVAFELALTCDIRVASPDARFGMPEVRIGMPSVADASLLQLHIGMSLAKEMLLTGELYSVEQLAPWGMINQIVPPDDLQLTTTALLKRIIRHNSRAVSSQKRLFEIWINTPHAAGVEASIKEFVSLFAYPDILDQIEQSTRLKNPDPSPARTEHD